MALANRAKKLMDSGVDTPAKIDSMSPTGNTDTPGGAENVIVATLHPESAESYQVTFNQYIYPSAPFSEGDEVTVKVDPADPNSVMIFGKR